MPKGLKYIDLPPGSFSKCYDESDDEGDTGI